MADNTYDPQVPSPSLPPPPSGQLDPQQMMDPNTRKAIAAILKSSMYDAQSKDIYQQLANQYALRNARQEKYTTGAGEALGGAGNILRNVVSQIRESKLRGKPKPDAEGNMPPTDLAGVQQAYMKALGDFANSYGQPGQVPGQPDPGQPGQPSTQIPGIPDPRLNLFGGGQQVPGIPDPSLSIFGG